MFGVSLAHRPHNHSRQRHEGRKTHEPRDLPLLRWLYCFLEAWHLVEHQCGHSSWDPLSLEISLAQHRQRCTSNHLSPQELLNFTKEVNLSTSEVLDQLFDSQCREFSTSQRSANGGCNRAVVSRRPKSNSSRSLVKLLMQRRSVRQCGRCLLLHLLYLYLL